MKFCRPNFRSFVATVLLTFLFPAALLAQAINWGAATTVTGEADVATNGYLCYACSAAPGAAVVNTVPFLAGFSGFVSVTGSAGTSPSTFGAGGTAPWSGLGTNYQTVLGGGIYAGAGTPLTVTLNNLTGGHAYLVQVWVNDSRAGGSTGRTETVTSPGGNTVTLAYNSTAAPGGVGQFAVGTFTATGIAETFTLNGLLPTNGTSSQLNALQVRDLTPVGLPAFPGAQGYGAQATGGRGGTVYHVTSLADSGAGTLREAVSQPNRTIVFDVGGLITLQSDLNVTNNNLTIAGQTAPGQGIGVYGNGNYGVKLFGQYATTYQGSNYWLTPGASNLICRYVRFREGYNTNNANWSLALINTKNTILDHCSIELGCWQTMCITYDPWAPPNYVDAPVNITLQNCIVGASIGNSLGCLLWFPQNVSLTHTLWIDNGGRDPKVWGNNQLINDVLYNPQLGIYGDGYEQVDFIGNYHILGPTFPLGNGLRVPGEGSYYITNNLLDSSLSGTLNGSVLGTNSSFNPASVSAVPFCYPPIPVAADPPTQAYYKVGSQAGCSLVRDAVDSTLVSQLLSLGKLGIHYTNEFQFSTLSLTGGTVPLDTDQDGMPDGWELATGSNWQVADNNVTNAVGYTLLEGYLNWLAAPHCMTSRNVPAAPYDLWLLSAAFTNQMPVFALSAPTNGSASLVSNRWVNYVPATNYVGLDSFVFTVKAADGTVMTNQVGVLVTPIQPATNLVWHGDNHTNVWNLYFTNDWFNGSVLQAFNGDDCVTFDSTGSNALPVTLVGPLSPAALTVSGTNNFVLTGPGNLVGPFTLVKTNTGWLTLAMSNAFSGGLEIYGGTVVLSNSISAPGSGVITLGGNGSVLNDVGLNLTNPLVVSGTNTWTVSGTGNINPAEPLAGNGWLYLNPVCSGIFTVSGDWSQFAGTLAWLPGNSTACRLNGTLGSASAWFNLGTNSASLYDRNGNLTVQLGALSGGTATTISGASAYANPTTYVIGGLNTNSVFAGKCADGSVVGAQTFLVKTGTGTLTLAGASTYSGTTTVSNGVLQINGSLPTNTVTVAGGALAGTGVVNGAVVVLAGGTLSPGAGSGTGTLTVSNNVNLAGGSTLLVALNAAAGTNSQLLVKGSLALNGTLTVTNLAGTFRAGQSYRMFSAPGISGGFSALTLPALPNGWVWNTNALAGSGVLSVLNLLPQVSSPVWRGTSLVWTGTNGLAGANYRVLSATNLAEPLTSWTPLATNRFDAAGNCAITNLVVPGARNQYFIIETTNPFAPGPW